MERITPQIDQTPLAGGACGTPAQDIAELPVSIVVGGFPKRKATVTAEVLVRLLRGQQMTGMDGVFEAGTTRLPDMVHRLGKKIYGWPILSEDRVVATSDGRTQTISVYFLPLTVREAGMQRGGRDYCAEVMKRRRDLRAKRHLAVRRAREADERLRRMANERQQDLFGGAAA